MDATTKISSFDRDDMSAKARRARELASTRVARGKPAEKSRRAVEKERNLPTPERLAKGDLTAKTAGGFHRAMAPIERMRDRNQLDHMPHINQAMFEAAEKLRRHYEACNLGVRAASLDPIIAGTSDDLEGEEKWVHHFDVFRKACKLMGWHDTCPHRGAGRIVVAVVCQERTVTDSAQEYIGPGRSETIQAAGMDRLREGLFALAAHWRLC